jgi:hypothetical protein
MGTERDGEYIDGCILFIVSVGGGGVVSFLFPPQTLHGTYLQEINDMGYSFVNPPAEGE